MTGVRWCLLARRARAIFDPSHGGSPETLCPAARRRSWAISVVAEEVKLEDREIFSVSASRKILGSEALPRRTPEIDRA